MRDYTLFDAIQYPMPIYKQCTLKEIIVVGCMVSLLTLILMPIVTGILLHALWLGFSLALPSSFGFTRWFVCQLERLKQDKPEGYAIQRLYRLLSQYGLYQSPYVTRVGRWCIGRR